MGKIKTVLLAVTGAALGVVTLRKLRSRSSEGTTNPAVSDQVTEVDEEVEEASDDIEEATEDVVEAKDEAVTAAKHAAVAVKHAGLAAGKAIRTRQQTTDDLVTDPAAVESNQHSG